MAQGQGSGGSAASKRLAEEKANRDYSNRGGRRDRGGRSGMGKTNTDSYRTSAKSGLKGFGMTPNAVVAQSDKRGQAAVSNLRSGGDFEFQNYSYIPIGYSDVKLKKGVTSKQYSDKYEKAAGDERKRYGVNQRYYTDYFPSSEQIGPKWKPSGK